MSHTTNVVIHNPRNQTEYERRRDIDAYHYEISNTAQDTNERESKPLKRIVGGALLGAGAGLALAATDRTNPDAPALIGAGMLAGTLIGVIRDNVKVQKAYLDIINREGRWELQYINEYGEEIYKLFKTREAAIAYCKVNKKISPIKLITLGNEIGADVSGINHLPPNLVKVQPRLRVYSRHEEDEEDDRPSPAEKALHGANSAMNATNMAIGAAGTLGTVSAFGRGTRDKVKNYYNESKRKADLHKMNDKDSKSHFKNLKQEQTNLQKEWQKAKDKDPLKADKIKEQLQQHYDRRAKDVKAQKTYQGYKNTLANKNASMFDKAKAGVGKGVTDARSYMAKNPGKTAAGIAGAAALGYGAYKLYQNRKRKQEEARRQAQQGR